MIKYLIFILANVLFIIISISEISWGDKEQVIYDLIVPWYAIINLLVLFFWIKIKNIKIKKIISWFNIVLNSLIIFLSIGGSMVMLIDDSKKNINLIFFLVFIIPITSIAIFKDINKK